MSLLDHAETLSTQYARWFRGNNACVVVYITVELSNNFAPQISVTRPTIGDRKYKSLKDPLIRLRILQQATIAQVFSDLEQA
jgi:hypothetical protein